ncbi:adenylate/guanylate cyclase domain-containing protein [Mycobacterium talmoniae]|uniref:Adenylate/guanylate cyclase domain-containing protein n=1 Tax=Mycobacterium talmoniae TaxID=1858794 RepID=A0A1S1NMV1_9MYCO|nr:MULTISPECIES: adenylate/guanylate cyclase domain-containing protein [Mycobacterium]OHV05606.1 adenylate/guanylate cyclase domain-containing protein [Mycobacterium talmoniae]TDH55534.1 adenylate/guanylate cyclase domain-containing protein [Mycobacterium eburneum]
MAFAHLLTAVEVVAVMMSLGGETQAGLSTLLAADTLITTAVLVGVGTVVAATGGAVTIAPSLRWFVPGREPDLRQRRTAINLVRRQSVILLSTWVGGGVGVLIALGGGARLTLLVVLAIVFGGTATVCTSLLFTQRTLRPIVAAASADFDSRETAPGVLARLVTMWVATSALPSAAVVMLIVCRWNGWILQRTASVELPVLVVSFVAMFLGLRAMILVARSISDPVRDVVEAMAEIEHGQLDNVVDVYEQSEIGRLQSGFNRMVAGLKERDRLRDLFGRHVGTAVANRAVQAGETLTGDVRPVAILFIDLAGSTTLTASRPPEEVAEVLNDFFRIVVAAVDQRYGLINKFQGDAALAVFGAPLRTDGAAAAALATARDLRTQLRRLPMLDFGIGVSAGPVFAGNIGSENRYEYTVIGDAVNEAARLADHAKATDARVLCSRTALTQADPDEQRRWAGHGSAVLRGRAAVTHMSAPVLTD